MVRVEISIICRDLRAIEGINQPWLYVGGLGSSFAAHQEDCTLTGVNYMVDTSARHVDLTSFKVPICSVKAYPFIHTLNKNETVFEPNPASVFSKVAGIAGNGFIGEQAIR
jgi:hypothetical protein